MTSPYQIVQLASLGQAVDEELDRNYSVLPLWQESDPLPRLAEAPDAILLITSARLGLMRSWLEALPGLKAVCSWGVGYDNFDMQAAGEHGVAVSNTPDVLDNCVADMAWALMFSVARRTGLDDRYVKSGSGNPRAVFHWARGCPASGWASWGWAASARPSPSAAPASIWTCAITIAANAPMRLTPMKLR